MSNIELNQNQLIDIIRCNMGYYGDTVKERVQRNLEENLHMVFDAINEEVNQLFSDDEKFKESYIQLESAILNQIKLDIHLFDVENQDDPEFVSKRNEILDRNNVSLKGTKLGDYFSDVTEEHVLAFERFKVYEKHPNYQVFLPDIDDIKEKLYELHDDLEVIELKILAYTHSSKKGYIDFLKAKESIKGEVEVFNLFKQVTLEECLECGITKQEKYMLAELESGDLKEGSSVYKENLETLSRFGSTPNEISDAMQKTMSHSPHCQYAYMEERKKYDLVRKMGKCPDS